jgi:hypothetical protein
VSHGFLTVYGLVHAQVPCVDDEQLWRYVQLQATMQAATPTHNVACGSKGGGRDSAGLPGTHAQAYTSPTTAPTAINLRQLVTLGAPSSMPAGVGVGMPGPKSVCGPTSNGGGTRVGSARASLSSRRSGGGGGGGVQGCASQHRRDGSVPSIDEVLATLPLEQRLDSSWWAAGRSGASTPSHYSSSDGDEDNSNSPGSTCSRWVRVCFGGGGVAVVLGSEIRCCAG